jgi:hypothetical protein
MPFEICRERPQGEDMYRVTATSSDDETMALRIELVTSDGEIRRFGDLTLPLTRVGKVRQVVNETLREVDATRPKATLEERRKVVQASHFPWSADEENALLRAIDAGESVDALAARHKRTVLAIRSRLVKLGRLEDWRATTPGA